MGEEFIAPTDPQQKQQVANLLETIHNCMIAAGGSQDLDELERQMNAVGTHPSHFIEHQMKQLRDRATKAEQALVTIDKWRRFYHSEPSRFPYKVLAEAVPKQEKADGS